MNKTEVVKIMQAEAKELGFDLTQIEVSNLLEVFENTCAKVGEELEVGESCFVSCVKVSKKQVDARKGTSILRGEEVEWETPAKTKLVLSTKDSFRKQHEIEL